MQAYCVKCKTKRELSGPRADFMANGRAITRGNCPVCGTGMIAMGETPAHAGMPRPEPVSKAPAAKTRKPAASKPRAAAKAKSSGKPARTAAKPATRKSAAKPGARATRAAKTTPSSTRPVRRSGKLVIVESPTKARSIGAFLGSSYRVMASKGHVRDLLKSRLSVDIENNFEPEYRVMNDKRDTVKELTDAVMRASEVYLATDPDREGEAIAWHLQAATEMHDVPIRRVVFHEITRPAIEEAFRHPREIDMNLVNAQQARRILDRLVGYNVSQLLWSKVSGGRARGLSAGRVQSVAVRLIVEREREIEAFVQREYWSIDAQLRKRSGGKSAEKPFLARLVSIAGSEPELSSQAEVQPHLDALEKSTYAVTEVKHGERQRKPSPPFTTSTLQQEASRRLGFSASRTMNVAQQLYEGISLAGEGSVGLITYMRTDSVSVSTQAQKETRDYVTGRFGKQFLPARPPMYRTRTRGAQEAHEAIRPTRIPRDPASVRSALTNDQYKLYNLIWQRFVASQMANALYNTLRVDIVAGPAAEPQRYGLRASGSIIRFQGFLVLYEDSRDEDLALDEDEGRILPEMTTGELLHLLALQPEQHFTQPPPRFTEASLVRTLEELGIGRPSTYAPTVAVIQDREYVAKEDKRLVPTETGRVVNDLLVSSFPDIFDFQFTARMEDELDDIADGRLDWRPMLGDFYGPFSRDLKQARELLPRVQAEDDDVGRDCPTCGKPLRYRYSKYGKFIGCSDYPNCRYTERIVEKVGVACPTCGTEKGGEIIARRTRTGREFFGCSRYPECEYTSWKRPLPGPCPHCGGMLVLSGRGTARCTVCGKTMRIAEQRAAETA